MRAAALFTWSPLSAGTPLLALLAAVAGCRGPQLHVQNDGGHSTFFDGRATFFDGRATSVERRATSVDGRAGELTLPFRYYGTTRWDALPKEQLEDGIPTFAQLPRSAAVTIEPPASLWLFPLDFAVEVFDWALHGHRDATTTIAVTDRPGDLTQDEQIPAAAIGKLRERALEARVQR